MNKLGLYIFLPLDIWYCLNSPLRGAKFILDLCIDFLVGTNLADAANDSVNLFWAYNPACCLDKATLVDFHTPLSLTSTLKAEPTPDDFLPYGDEYNILSCGLTGVYLLGSSALGLGEGLGEGEGLLGPGLLNGENGDGLGEGEGLLGPGETFGENGLGLFGPGLTLGENGDGLLPGDLLGPGLIEGDILGLGDSLNLLNGLE